MKIHSIYNSRKDLLATFVSESELIRFIRRHSRDASDTTVLTTIADSWNEINEVKNTTKDWMDSIWN